MAGFQNSPRENSREKAAGHPQSPEYSVCGLGIIQIHARRARTHGNRGAGVVAEMVGVRHNHHGNLLTRLCPPTCGPQTIFLSEFMSQGSLRDVVTGGDLLTIHSVS